MQGGLVLKTTLLFDPSEFPGYAHRRTIGFKEGISRNDSEELQRGGGEARVYVFTTKKEPVGRAMEK